MVKKVNRWLKGGLHYFPTQRGAAQSRQDFLSNIRGCTRLGLHSLSRDMRCGDDIGVGGQG